MAKLPSGRDVERALRTVNLELRGALKQINHQAGKLLAKGRYEEAEQLVAAAKAVGQFQADYEQLRSRWKQLKTLGAGVTEPQSALWEYYQPIVDALTKLGGEADRHSIEDELEGMVRARLKPGDLRKNVRGVAKWQIMLRRAKRPMIEEGFIERASGKTWRLTEKALSGANH